MSVPSFDFEASSHGSPVRAPLRPLHVDGQVCAGLTDSAATIVDAHNDLLLETVVLRKEQSLGLVLRRGRERLFERYWLPRLEAGAVGVQVCPLYAASWPLHEARDRAFAQEAEFMRAIEENAGRVCHARTGAELDDQRLRLVLSMEGLEPLQGDPNAFDEWYGRGVRSASLTWNYANAFAGGIDTPSQGLSEQGRTLVRRFAELGVVLDLAHASEQTWRDVIAEEVPFSVTHAGCRAVYDRPRNLADWQLEALAERGGVLGMIGLALFVDPQAPTLARWLDHIDHAVRVMGIEHIGLGADFVDQVAQAVPGQGLLHGALHIEGAEAKKAQLTLEGFRGPEDYPTLVAALRERGYRGERLEAITSGNWLRILREALPAY